MSSHSILCHVLCVACGRCAVLSLVDIFPHPCVAQHRPHTQLFLACRITQGELKKNDISCGPGGDPARVGRCVIHLWTQPRSQTELLSTCRISSGTSGTCSDTGELGGCGPLGSTPVALRAGSAMETSQSAPLSAPNSWSRELRRWSNCDRVRYRA